MASMRAARRGLRSGLWTIVAGKPTRVESTVGTSQFARWAGTQTAVRPFAKAFSMISWPWTSRRSSASAPTSFERCGYSAITRP